MDDLRVNWFLRILYFLIGLSILLVPVILMLGFYFIPEEKKQDVVSLAGIWEIREWKNEEKHIRVSPEKWSTFRIPGVFYRQGYKGTNYILRKTIVVKPAMTNDNLYIFMSATRMITGRISFNGHYVGEIGTYSANRNLKGIEGATGLYVPKEIVSGTTNLIQMVLRQNIPDYDRFADGRLYLGKESHLKVYFENNEKLYLFFQYGYIYFCLFMMLLLVIIIVIEGASSDQKIHVRLLVFLFSGFLYNFAFSGIVLPSLTDIKTESIIIKITIELLCLTFYEFNLMYFQKKENTFSKVTVFMNRLIILGFISGLILLSGNMVWVQKLYELSALYILFVIFFLLAFSISMTIRVKPDLYSMMILFGQFLTTVGGAVGLLNNLSLIEFPQVLFSMTLSDAAIISIMVAITEYLNRNRKIKELNYELMDLNVNLEYKVAERTRELREKQEQQDNELKIAKGVQVALIPNLSGMQIRNKTEFGALYKPAQDVGGDLFDVNCRDDNTCFIMIADVSGHGVSAALVTFMVKALCYVYNAMQLSPKEMCQRINQKMIEMMGGSEKYISVLFAKWNSENKTLKYTDGGHVPFLLYKKNQNEVLSVKMQGIIVGMFPNAEFQEEEMTLEAGDAVVFYTDGVIEVQNSEEETFGEERLKRFIVENVGLSATDFIREIESELVKFGSMKSVIDDQTILFMKVQ